MVPLPFAEFTAIRLGLSIGVGGKQYGAGWATIAYCMTDRILTGYYIDRYHEHQQCFKVVAGRIS